MGNRFVSVITFIGVISVLLLLVSININKAFTYTAQKQDLVFVDTSEQLIDFPIGFSNNTVDILENVSREENKQIKDTLVNIKKEVKEPVKVKAMVDIVQERILVICDSLNNNIESTPNTSPIIGEILSFNKLPNGLAYCGAAIYYILSKAGINYDVYKPYWASNNFVDKSKIVFSKGKWFEDPDSLKVGYVVGYRLGKDKSRINHVGLWIKDANPNETNRRLQEELVAFEGNTSNPFASKEEGFFYKKRKYNISYIRKWEL
jgi:hypothetical protein